LNEGMGRVIVEGGFLGKAVVGTKVGGIPDLIEDGETGLLVECRNPSAVVRAVVRLLEDPGLSRLLGERLKAKALNGFTEEQMVEKIHDVYIEALERKGLRLGRRPASGQEAKKQASCTRTLCRKGRPQGVRVQDAC